MMWKFFLPETWRSGHPHRTVKTHHKTVHKRRYSHRLLYPDLQISLVSYLVFLMLCVDPETEHCQSDYIVYFVITGCIWGYCDKLQLAWAVSCDPFKSGSPNLEHRFKTHSVFCQGFGKWGQMTHTIEKHGDIGNFSVTSVILPFMNLKYMYVGTLAPTAKIIVDIPDFNVLNVPKMQPRHNTALWLTLYMLNFS